MKTALSVLALFWTFAAGAAPVYQLTDAAILGVYRDETSDLGEIRLRYDTKGILMVDFEYDGMYAAQTMSPEGVILETDTNNECDDPGCGFIAYYKVTLKAVQRDGQWIPALDVNVTKDYPFPEEQGDPEGAVDQVYSYVWNEPMQYAVPPYKELPASSHLKAQLKTCYDLIKGVGITAASVCPEVTSYKFSEAISPDSWTYFAQQEISAKDVSQNKVDFSTLDSVVFKMVEARVAGAGLKNKSLDVAALSKTTTAIRDNVKKYSEELYYFENWGGGHTIYSVNTKAKTVYRYKYLGL